MIERVGIFVDTNQVVPDPYFSGDAWARIFRFCRRNGWCVLLSDVVFREAVEKFRDDLKKHEPSARRFAQLSGDPELNVDVEDIARSYAEGLERLGEPFTALQRVPLPPVAHDAVLDRLFTGKKPYTRNSTKDGYRDYLIWQSLLSCAVGADQIHFISANTSDFHADDRDKTKPLSLHSDLLDDMGAIAVPPTRIRCFRTRQDFVDSVVTPLEATIRSLQERLEATKEQFRAEFDAAVSGDWPRSVSLARLNSSFDCDVLQLESCAQPVVGAITVHDVFTLDGTTFQGRLAADVRMSHATAGSSVGDDHFHLKMRVKVLSDGFERADRSSALEMSAGSVDYERSTAKTRWNRPWW